MFAARELLSLLLLVAAATVGGWRGVVNFAGQMDPLN